MSSVLNFLYIQLFQGYNCDQIQLDKYDVFVNTFSWFMLQTIIGIS